MEVSTGSDGSHNDRAVVYTGFAVFVRMPGDVLHYHITRFDVDVSTVVCIDDVTHPINESFYASPTILNCPLYSNHPSYVLYPKRFIFAEVELRTREGDPDGIVYDEDHGIYYSRCMYIKSIIPYDDFRIEDLKKYKKIEKPHKSLSDDIKRQIDTAPEDKEYTIDGTIILRHNGIIHNPDGPAIIAPNGIKRYYLYGEEYHIEYPDGSIYHLMNGELHCDDGPAVVTPTGVMYWQNGELHRTDGPAIVNKDGSYEYYYHNVWHNPAGPAVRTADGSEYIYLLGDLRSPKPP
jgi:hypothetical protein